MEIPLVVVVIGVVVQVLSPVLMVVAHQMKSTEVEVVVAHLMMMTILEVPMMDVVIVVVLLL
eukprot:2595201-Karenia_brevis.AAC.1